MQIDILVTALAAFGWQGLAIAGIIILAVFAAKLSGLVATGNQARFANIVLSAILYGLSDNPKAEGALLAALSSILAGLGYEFIRWIKNRSV